MSVAPGMGQLKGLPTETDSVPRPPRIYGIRFSGDPVDSLTVTEGHRISRVLVDDIVRVSADDDYVIIHAAGRRHMVFIRLTHLAERLGPERFLRVHRSHLVHRKHIVSADRHPGKRLRLTLSDGSSVLTSRRLRADVWRRLLTQAPFPNPGDFLEATPPG